MRLGRHGGLWRGRGGLWRLRRGRSLWRRRFLLWRGGLCLNRDDSWLDHRLCLDDRLNLWRCLLRCWRGRLRRHRRLRRGSLWRSRSGCCDLRSGRRRLWFGSKNRRMRLRLVTGLGELWALGFDDDSLGAPARNALANGRLFNARTLQRQRLLWGDGQRMIVAGFRVGHSISSAAVSASAIAANIASSSGEPPR